MAHLRNGHHILFYEERQSSRQVSVLSFQYRRLFNIAVESEIEQMLQVLPG